MDDAAGDGAAAAAPLTRFGARRVLRAAVDKLAEEGPKKFGFAQFYSPSRNEVPDQSKMQMITFKPLS